MITKSYNGSSFFIVKPEGRYARQAIDVPEGYIVLQTENTSDGRIVVEAIHKTKYLKINKTDI